MTDDDHLRQDDDMTSNLTPLTRNVTRVYRAASADHVAAGLDWYRTALEAATLAAADTGHTVATAAGVLAALSPRMPWNRNVLLMRRALVDGYASGTLTTNTRKADAILAGADPLDILSGDKVRAFYRDIISAGTDAAVCVDRHAFDIAVGRRTDDSTRAQLARKGEYDRVARVYRAAAAILSRESDAPVSAAQVQAVTWVAWRARHGIAD